MSLNFLLNSQQLFNLLDSSSKISSPLAAPRNRQQFAKQHMYQLATHIALN